MDPHEAYLEQLHLECKRLLPSGRLEEIPCPHPDGLAEISVVRFPTSDHEGTVHLRVDASAAAAAAVATTTAVHLLGAPEAELARLGLRRNFSGRTGVFSSMPTDEDCAGADHSEGQWVALVDGVPAAVAFSARESVRAAELSVETDTGFRRRGLARRVASAWARDVLERGLVAFYSYSFSNTASERLASSLGVEVLFEAGSFELVLDD